MTRPFLFWVSTNEVEFERMSILSLRSRFLSSLSLSSLWSRDDAFFLTWHCERVDNLVAQAGRGKAGSRRDHAAGAGIAIQSGTSHRRRRSGAELGSLWVRHSRLARYRRQTPRARRRGEGAGRRNRGICSSERNRGARARSKEHRKRESEKKK